MHTRSIASSLIALLVCLIASPASAQHLWWDTRKLNDATCVYGEITVLATHQAIYYCGANWHPGEPAGGYCGIQHNHPKEKRTIFSIWDTTKDLHPHVSAADAQTIFNRFGGEGEGAHTHMLWDWQLGETFQFFVEKFPVSTDNITAAKYSIYDRNSKIWRHSATIISPNGDAKSAKSVATLGGGGLVSFLENFSGKDKDVPKLALYRLWLGSSPSDMKCLTQAQGDGTWGQLHDTFFLAEGDRAQLDALVAKLKEKYGEAKFGEAKKKLEPISDRPLDAELVKALQAIPPAPKVQGAPK